MSTTEQVVAGVRMRDVIAVGSPYLDQTVMVDDEFGLEKVQRTIANVLYYLALGKAQGKSMTAHAERFIASLTELGALDAMIKESEYLALISVGALIAKDTKSVNEGYMLGKDTLAYLDGVVYLTPVDFVTGSSDTSIEALAQEVIEGIQMGITTKLESLREKAGVDKETAQAAFSSLTGIESGEVRGLALVSDTPSALFTGIYGATVDNSVVVGILLTPWGVERSDNPTEEEIVKENALAVVKEAALLTFAMGRLLCRA